MDDSTRQIMVHVGIQPFRMAVHEGRKTLYVANSGEKTISVIEYGNVSPLKSVSIKLEGQPHSIAIAKVAAQNVVPPENRAWVAYVVGTWPAWKGFIAQFDTSTNQIVGAAIPIPERAHPPALVDMVWNQDNGFLYVCDKFNDVVLVIEGHEIIKTLHLHEAANVMKLARSRISHRLYTANSGRQDVTSIDTWSNAIDGTIGFLADDDENSERFVPRGVNSVAVDSGHISSPGTQSQNLYAVHAPYAPSFPLAAFSPEDVARSPRSGASRIQIIHTDQNKVVQYVDFGEGSLQALAIDGRRGLLYAGGAMVLGAPLGKTLCRLNTVTNLPLDPLTVDGIKEITDIAVDEVSGTVFVSDIFSNAVVIVYPPN